MILVKLISYWVLTLSTVVLSALQFLLVVVHTRIIIALFFNFHLDMVHQTTSHTLIHWSVGLPIDTSLGTHRVQ